MKKLAKSSGLVRTMVDLPAPLLVAADAALRRGAARSRNALISKALERMLCDLDESEIDRQFAAMQEDDEYRELMEQVASEFADSDWEAFEITEGGVASAKVAGTNAKATPNRKRRASESRRRVSSAT